MRDKKNPLANIVATGSTHQQRLVQSDPLTQINLSQIPFGWQAAKRRSLANKDLTTLNIKTMPSWLSVLYLILCNDWKKKEKKSPKTLQGDRSEPAGRVFHAGTLVWLPGSAGGDWKVKFTHIGTIFPERHDNNRTGCSVTTATSAHHFFFSF